MTTLTQIIDHKIVAILRGVQPNDAVKIATALYKGGIRIIEVTLNSAGALAVIEKLCSLYENQIVIGAGTVLDTNDAKAAIKAGAGFLISPILDIEVIKTAKEAGVVSIPGAYTPTEILTAHRNGADIIKVFPAPNPEYIKSILAPLNNLLLMPTGGVDLDNIKAFKSAGAIAFGLGSSLINTKSVVNDEYLHNLTLKARSFMEAIQ